MRAPGDVDGRWERAHQRGAGLGEEYGRLWQGQGGFGGVVAVVEAEAADEVAVAAVDGGEELGFIVRVWFGFGGGRTCWTVNCVLVIAPLKTVPLIS